MIRKLIAAAGVCLAAALTANGALAHDIGARANACTAGVTSAGGGLKKRVFCGSARVVVKVAGKTITLSQGQCVATSKYLTVNIGTLYLGRTTKPKPNYFGLDVGQVPGMSTSPAGRDGTYKSGIELTVNYHNVPYIVIDGATATLKANRSQGP